MHGAQHLTELLDHEHSDRVALVFDGVERTHRELHERASRVAGALAARGVRAGDRVAMLLHNGLEFPETLLACLRLGAIAVPINFRLTQNEIDYILADCGAAVLVDGPLDHEPAPRAPIESSDPALLCYTSGTTGRPKGAVLTHANLVASTLSWIHEMGATADDVWLSGQPLFHIGGINGMLPFLALGATAILTPTTGFDPAHAVRLMEQHAVTMCIFVPTQWDQVTAIAQRTRLRVAMWGAAPASRKTLEALARTYPGVDIVSAYGQTEMSGATTLLKGPDATRKMGSVGKPMRDVELRLEDEVDGVGEIVYRGPFVMQGYWNDADATAEAFAGGWFHSGDLATRDAEGYLRLVDRKKDMIVSGGENIYPAEVERVLREHPAVADVAVVGVPHPRWGETPVAFVVGACTEHELIGHCRAHLASYKKPTAIHFVTSLPRNAAGKVLKRELRP
ncbi:AMP-binding protein [Solirubrobacter ginsenosidimutans]|uniref:AMP-binding protein n=1 Tax=Solirubrobacter ginsenosidimutans TaxID=490573 RepID=A0A9X3MM82_9ACTN|nr:AMP-binding protein [Solirubrobacter ginsenosidimutans]MDA0158697.1 AMP-binding protein [Solirubrobacter ginsenosidimutans]